MSNSFEFEFTGCFDIHNKPIHFGQIARTWDRENNEWIGIIDFNKADYIVNGQKVNGVYVFRSNMTIWLNKKWTAKQLEIIMPIKRNIKKMMDQRKLEWGHYYSNRTLEYYYD